MVRLLRRREELRLANCYTPNVCEPRRVVALADFSDLLPTFCELASVRMPSKLKIDGKSFAGFLLGKPKARAPRRWIFNQYGDERVVRDERHNLAEILTQSVTGGSE